MVSRRRELGIDRMGGHLLLLAGAGAFAVTARHAGGIPVELTVLGSIYGVLGIATGIALSRGSSLTPYGFALWCASFVALLSVAPGDRPRALIPVFLGAVAGIVLLRRLLARIPPVA